MTSYASLTLGGPDRNAEKLGTYIAFMINNHLLADTLERSYGTEITRVRMHDLSGAGFLSKVLDGELKPEHLTQEGQMFTERYLLSGEFSEDYASNTASVKASEDDWELYRAVSAKMTQALMTFRSPKQPKQKSGSNIIQFPFGKK